MSAKKITILDGGMGRELERRGAPFRQPEWSALAMMEAPSIVQAVHQAFLESGATVITTNSYSLVPFHIGEEVFAQRGLELILSAGKVAQAARQQVNSNAQIAGSIPPLFGSYRADLYRADRIEEVVTPLIKGLDDYCDFWLLETQSLIEESKAVIEQIHSQSQNDKAIWVSFTLEDSEPTAQPILRSGELVADAVLEMSKLGVNAILFNCCQPEIIEAALQVSSQQLEKNSTTEIALGAYANAFPPQPKDATANDGLDELRNDLAPTAYLDWAKRWKQQGATLIGGCCGIGPEHIAELSKHLN
jgi:S-methylmethionine-dependent homocysteine/selenocysteine methylase